MAKSRVTPRDTGSATARRGPRGRSWIALFLFGFFLLGAGVIWRRAEGHKQAQDLRVLEEKRTQLEAQRAQLESELRDLTSRAKLAPVAEGRLHMHIPNDTELVILRRTPRTP